MGDRITDERLREIASSDPLVLAICAKMGEPSWSDVRAIAAELLAARMRIRSDEEHLPTIGKMAKDLAETEDELDGLRADLREAMELLRAHGQPPDWITLGDAADWNCRYGKLLQRHQ